MAFNYTLSTPGTYGFVNQGSYLESNNQGKSSSYALSVLTFTVPAGESYHLYLDCVNYAESNYDYGIVSNINMSLSRSSTGDTDTSLVKQNFKGHSSANIQTLDYGIVTTGGTIDLKFRKDSSVNSNNDSLRVTVRAEAIQVIPSISLSELTGIFYGTNEIGKVYYGANLVYGTAPAPTPVLYDITTTIINGTYSGPIHLYEGETTATITLTAYAGYTLPYSITVSGASYTYNSSTGEVVLSSFTGDATISAACYYTETGYLTFSSPSSFTINNQGQYTYWNGTLYYSTNKTTWNVWDGKAITAVANNGTYYLYFRGTSNTKITGMGSDGVRAKWVLTGNNISCSGNIETLLDYQTVLNGNHPTMLDACYSYMFSGCTSLTTAPVLRANTLTTECYKEMFRGCTSLVTAPVLPATTLANNCYSSMFQGCTSLAIAPALPATTLANNCYSGMFVACTSLTTAPALPATTLADSCYSTMFNGCASLTTAPALPATVLVNNCYSNMFAHCTSLTTPAIMAGGTTQAVAAQYCCSYMYNNCTSLNIYTSSSGHTPFYKAITYSQTSGDTNYNSSFRMFYNCKVNGATSTTDYFTTGIQYYRDAPSTITLITFTVRGTSYSADSGMAWTHFVESAYNINNTFSIISNMVAFGSRPYFVEDASGRWVSATDQIIDNYAYDGSTP